MQDVGAFKHDGYAFHSNTFFLTGEAQAEPLPFLGSSANVAAMRSKLLAEILKGSTYEYISWVDRQIDRKMESSERAGKLGFKLMVELREREDARENCN